MPVNDIIAELSVPGNGPDAGEAPSDDGRPDPDSSQATTMRTPRMIPPYIHNQTLSNRSALALVGTVASLLGALSWVTRNAN